MSCMNVKKFESLIFNIDKNSYRAYQNILHKNKENTKASIKFNHRTNSDIKFKTYNEREFNYPYDLKEKTDLPQTYLRNNSKQKNISKKSSCIWDEIKNQSSQVMTKPIKRNFNKRNKENSCTFRTVNHLSKEVT